MNPFVSTALYRRKRFTFDIYELSFAVLVFIEFCQASRRQMVFSRVIYSHVLANIVWSIQAIFSFCRPNTDLTRQMPCHWLSTNCMSVGLMAYRSNFCRSNVCRASVKRAPTHFKMSLISNRTKKIKCRLLGSISGVDAVFPCHIFIKTDFQNLY